MSVPVRVFHCANIIDGWRRQTHRAGVVLAAAAAAQACGLVRLLRPSGDRARAAQRLRAQPARAGSDPDGEPASARAFALLAAGIAVDRFGSRRTMVAGTALGVGRPRCRSADRLEGDPLRCAARLGDRVRRRARRGRRSALPCLPGRQRGWALGVRQMAVPLGGTVAALLLPVLESLGGVRLAVSRRRRRGGGQRSDLRRAAREAIPSAARTRSRGYRRIVRARGDGAAPRRRLALHRRAAGVLTYAVPAVRAAGLSSFSASATFFTINGHRRWPRGSSGVGVADRAAGHEASADARRDRARRRGRRRPLHASRSMPARRGHRRRDRLRLRRVRVERHRLRQRRRAGEPRARRPLRRARG